TPVMLSDPTVDIDRYQIAGVWVVRHGIRRDLRFRNGLLEAVFRGLRRPDQVTLDPKLTEILRLQKTSRGTPEIPDRLECISNAWTIIWGISGRAQLVRRADDRKTGLAVDEFPVARLALASAATGESNGRQIHTHAERTSAGWVLDTHWPESEEPV